MATTEEADRSAIRDLLYRYARALDLRDFAAVGRCFAPGARAEYSGLTLSPGVDAILAHLRQISAIPASTHLVGNVLIELHGDSAEVDSQAIVHLVLDSGPHARVRVRGLYYHDRVVRQGETWVIAERVHRAGWSLELGGA